MNDDCDTHPVTNAEIDASKFSGRNLYFDQLMAWYASGRLTPLQLAMYLLDAWIGAEWPRETALHHLQRESDVVEMFKLAGFLSDDPKMLPPSAPMRLYRGSTEYGDRGFSWTKNPETARWFARREAVFNHEPENYGDPVIIAATIQPDQILAIVTQGRNEAEVIIDPIDAALDIDAGVYFYDLDTPDIDAAVETVLAARRG